MSKNCQYKFRYNSHLKIRRFSSKTMIGYLLEKRIKSTNVLNLLNHSQKVFKKEYLSVINTNMIEFTCVNIIKCYIITFELVIFLADGRKLGCIASNICSMNTQNGKKTKSLFLLLTSLGWIVIMYKFVWLISSVGRAPDF